MKIYSKISLLIGLWIILLSSNLNAQSTSKRGSFNFDFGIPLNNKMKMIIGNSSSRTSSSNSQMFLTIDRMATFNKCKFSISLAFEILM